jgi:uncharacterized membrane protein
MVLVMFVASVAAPATLLAQEDRTRLDLRLLPGYYFSEVIPGERNTMYLDVVNTGEGAVTDITLRADMPEGWSVSFSPASVDYLAEGESHPVDIVVIPAEDARRGEYNVVLIAEANETRAVTSTTFRVESGASFWTWVGVVVVAVVVAGFTFVYLRMGRQ